MRRRLLGSAIIAALVVVSAVAASGGGLVAAAPPQCFPQATGFCIAGRFQEHWLANGGLSVNGYPLTSERRERLEDGNEYTVQYFERVRLEYHPENPPPHDVLLGQLGRRIHPADPPVGAEEGSTYFPETGHNVGPRFTAYWEANGGLAQFGFPVSELFEERLEDGNTYLVQYFERARFEYHPENEAPFDVLLGQFGRRILAQTGGRRGTPAPRAATPTPRPGPTPIAPATPAPGQPAPPPIDVPQEGQGNEGAVLIRALRSGGYVIFFRHAATDYTKPDNEFVDLADCATQRNLSEQGREDARVIGTAFAVLQIPVEGSLASPFCRTRETAELAFGRVEIASDLVLLPGLDQPDERERLLRATIALLTAPPAAGTNTVLVGHDTSLQALAGFSVVEGEAAIFEPVPEGGFRLVARVKPDEWPTLARRGAGE